jgi:predicted nucleic acid-binding protein
MRRLDLVDLLPAVAVAAGDLAEAHALRAHDAVHLASALSVRDVGLVLASWDNELRRAASASGLAIAPGSTQG